MQVATQPADLIPRLLQGPSYPWLSSLPLLRRVEEPEERYRRVGSKLVGLQRPASAVAARLRGDDRNYCPFLRRKENHTARTSCREVGCMLDLIFQMSSNVFSGEAILVAACEQNLLSACQQRDEATSGDDAGSGLRVLNSTFSKAFSCWNFSGAAYSATSRPSKILSTTS